VPALEVRLLDEPACLPAVASLFDAVWPASGGYAPDLLRAISHAGGYVAGAFREPDLLGASFGFLGRSGDALVLHSHVTGVRPGVEHAGVGLALKHHQRNWARANGLVAITWTFDPLVRRNAWFNLGKLGAGVTAYAENFYGTLTDAINRDDETDRLIVWWSTELDTGPDPSRDRVAIGPVEGFEVVDPGGSLHDPLPDEPVLLAWTPPDLVGLRRRDPDTATRWRHALRAGVGGSMARGYLVSGFTRDGCYVLQRAEVGS